MSIAYGEALRATPAGDRIAPSFRWWLLPACWIRGHVWAGACFEITSYRAQFCERCGEEVAGRTSLHQLEPRPLDDCDDLPWMGYDYGSEDGRDR
jgi:hypothetical protein